MMANNFCRTWARVVAYVDLVLSILMLMLVFTFTYLLITVPGCTLEVTDEKVIGANYTAVAACERCKAVQCRWTWFWVAWLAVVTGLQLWASLNLLSATEFGRDVNEALEKARFWRNVTFVFLVMDVADFAGKLVVYGFAGWHGNGFFWRMVELCFIIWRVNFLFIVYEFMEKLETTLVPGGVGVAEAGRINPGRVFLK